MICASAPLRVCDNGGWTDTWFAGHGAVFNIAVTPAVRVRLDAGRPHTSPLVRAAVGDRPVDISCAVPAGAATGTSASVAVALLGALAFERGDAIAPDAIAAAAHRLEVETLGLESGVQDQLCAAYGGINYIEITAYPAATVTPLAVDPAVWDLLDARLVLVYLGRPHRSSAVHDQVIASDPDLGPLRHTAAWSRDAVLAGDLEELGRAMTANCDAQAALHPDLVCPDAHRVIELARASGAWGWKVNGAGGDGGSLTVLAGPRPLDLRDEFEVIPMSLSPAGLRVYAQP